MPTTIPATDSHAAPVRRRRQIELFSQVARRWPFVWLFVIVIASNVFGSVFNIAYNRLLIVNRYLDAAQRDVFLHTALPIYNGIAYPLCLGFLWYLLLPLVRCRRILQSGGTEQRGASPAEMERCRRLLINMPVYAVGVSLAGWLPGAAFFPLTICWLGGTHAAGAIWAHFFISFLISALLTTVQTFILLERHLIRRLYSEFFRDARPAEMQGVIRVPFGLRLLVLWSAVALTPIAALLIVVVNMRPDEHDFETLLLVAVAVAFLGVAVSGFIFSRVGRDWLNWIDAQAGATEQITLGNFDHRIVELRPDEWGRLTDRFNDMTAALGRAQQLRETFGQMVSPEVRDEIMQNYLGLGGEVQEVTVLFADIRGFTQRTVGAAPERVVAVLNRFLTLAVAAVEAEGGLVNKFLGDGIMALFNAPRRRADHADRAVAAARAMLTRLAELNRALEGERQAPLEIGIGIHTGPALVGCIGATLLGDDGQQRTRFEFTAIGETVNLGQRLEQLTKQGGGPILVSESCRARLTRPVALSALEPQTVPGVADMLVVYAVREM